MEVLSTQVRACAVIEWRWNLACLYQYPPPHGPLLRAEDPDGVVDVLFLWELAC